MYYERTHESSKTMSRKVVLCLIVMTVQGVFKDSTFLRGLEKSKVTNLSLRNTCIPVDDLKMVPVTITTLELFNVSINSTHLGTVNKLAYLPGLTWLKIYNSRFVLVNSN